MPNDSTNLTPSIEQHFERLQEQLRHQIKSQKRCGKNDRLERTTSLMQDLYVEYAGNPDKLALKVDVDRFLTIASAAIRNDLVDRARKANALKRGGGRKKLDIDIVVAMLDAAPSDPESINELREAVQQLAAAMSNVLSPEENTLLTMRYFGGIGPNQLAELYRVKRGKINRDIKRALDKLRNACADADGTT